jgi:integrase/recombinase XerD
MKHDLQEVGSLKQKPIGPLVNYLEPFANRLVEQGYCRRCIGPKIRVIAKFSKRLHVKRISACDVTQEHVQQFFQGTNKKVASKRGEIAVLNQLIIFLQHLGISQQIDHPVKRTPIQRVIDSFGFYLLVDKGLSQKTLVQYAPTIEHFLADCFGKETVRLSALSGKNIIDFIQHQATYLSTARMKVTTTALRSFLRYAVYHGNIDAGLIEAVPTVVSWSMTGIPKAISPEHIQAVLAHCHRDTPIGRRDYAILMILAHLGLRSGEIVSLTLDSIDWEGGSITVSGKCGQRTCLPLPTAVGEALVDYLQHGRPSCNDRALFLRTIAPIRGLGAQQTIATIVNAAMIRAGIETPSRGAHQFRHAVATNMLRQGASLIEIGSLLRHKHPKTTNIYAKVDLKALRALGMPWLSGGVQ